MSKASSRKGSRHGQFKSRMSPPFCSVGGQAKLLGTEGEIGEALGLLALGTVYVFLMTEGVFFGVSLFGTVTGLDSLGYTIEVFLESISGL